MSRDAVNMAVLGSALLLALSPAAARAQAVSNTTGPIEIGGVSDSQCSLTVGKPSVAGVEGLYSAVIPISIGCNSAFTLRAASALGAFQIAGAGGGFEAVEYDVIWPASLTDGSGAAIALDFNASGEEWLAGITAVSGATREQQIAPMIVRLRGSVAPGAQLVPDVFMIDIEQN